MWLPSDARSSRNLRKTEMGDYPAAGGYAAPGAPLVVGDKLIVGMAGGEHGIQCDSWTPTIPRQANACGRPTPFPSPANRTSALGLATPLEGHGGVTAWNNGSTDPGNQHSFLGHQQSLAGL